MANGMLYRAESACSTRIQILYNWSNNSSSLLIWRRNSEFRVQFKSQKMIKAFTRPINERIIVQHTGSLNTIQADIWVPRVDCSYTTTSSPALKPAVSEVMDDIKALNCKHCKKTFSQSNSPCFVVLHLLTLARIIACTTSQIVHPS